MGLLVHPTIRQLLRTYCGAVISVLRCKIFGGLQPTNPLKDLKFTVAAPGRFLVSSSPLGDLGRALSVEAETPGLSLGLHVPALAPASPVDLGVSLPVRTWSALLRGLRW